MACSTKPNFWRSLVPSSPPRWTAHAKATCLDAEEPPWSLATLMASSHIPLARYICTAFFQNFPSTKWCSACLSIPSASLSSASLLWVSARSSFLYTDTSLIICSNMSFLLYISIASSGDLLAKYIFSASLNFVLCSSSRPLFA